jgi:hypothetical protein
VQSQRTNSLIERDFYYRFCQIASGFTAHMTFASIEHLALPRKS